MTDPYARLAERALRDEPLSTADALWILDGEDVALLPLLHAAYQNTLNITMIQSGIKANVIPAKSTAVIDCRLLPGQSHDAFLAELREVIDDGQIEISTQLRSESGASDFDTELVSVIREVVGEQVEGAIMVSGVAYIFTAMMVDILYGYADPRVRIG